MVPNVNNTLLDLLHIQKELLCYFNMFPKIYKYDFIIIYYDIKNFLNFKILSKT